MKMSNIDVENYIDLWLAVKPYLNPKEKVPACEKFLSVIDESVCEISEVYSEWTGYDSTLDKVIRENYVEVGLGEYNDDDEQYDDW